MSKKKQTARAPAEGPPDDFCKWWNPSGRQEPSGADIGGHPDAERVWARKDPGRWTRRTYGINAVTAWQCLTYRQEFETWQEAGSPASKTFVSLAATIERHKEFWHEVSAELAQIVKPVPKAKQRDYDKGKAPWREPIDEVKALPEAGVVDAEFTKLDDDAIDFNHRGYNNE